MGNFGLNGGIPYLADTDGATCFVCKQVLEAVKHFLLLGRGLDSLWEKLKTKVRELNSIDQNLNFITNLDEHHKMLLLFGGLQLPSDNTAIYSINRFVSAVFGKTYKIRTEMLLELGAPWLTNQLTLTLL